MQPYKTKLNYRISTIQGMVTFLAFCVGGFMFTKLVSMAPKRFIVGQTSLALILTIVLVVFILQVIIIRAIKSFFGQMVLTVNETHFSIESTVPLIGEKFSYSLRDMSRIKSTTEQMVTDEVWISGIKVSGKVLDCPVLQFRYMGEIHSIGTDWEDFNYQILANEIRKRKRLLKDETVTENTES